MPAIQAIIPLFILIVLGFLLARYNWLSKEAVSGLASITFKVFMPVLMFSGVAKSSLQDGFSLSLLLAYYLPVLIVFVVVNLLSHRLRGEPSAAGLAAAYSNNVLVGIPMVTALLGPGGLVYVFSILLFHSVLLFSWHSLYMAFFGEGKFNVPALLKNLANPLIIGLLLGAMLNLSGVEVPAMLWSAVTWLAQASLPCALIILGASLAQYRLRPTRLALGLTAAKLLMLPALVWWVTSWVPGLNETARLVLVMLAANPTGVNVLAFVRSDEDSRLISSVIFMSTIFAAISLPLWMALVELG